MKSNLTTLCVIAIMMTGATLAAETVRWLPAAASNDGAFGTRWTTTLWVHNLATDSEITVYASFYPDEEGSTTIDEVAIVAPPIQPVEIHDVVMELFSESRAGAIRLRSEHPFEARSRTANDGGAEGSFGQGIPALDPDAALPFGALIGAANIPGDDGVRTNLGVVNPGEQDASVAVFIWKYTPTGEIEYMGFYQMEVAAHGWTQDNLFGLVGDEDESIENAWVIVAADNNPDQPENRVFSYLSRIDNRSGDAAYVEPFLNPVYWVYPESADVTFSVDASAAHSLYAISYSVGEGEPVTVFEPASDWSMVEQSSLGRTVCMQVIARVESSGGPVLEACIEGGLGASTNATCNQCQSEVGDLCQIETCRFIY